MRAPPLIAQCLPGLNPHDSGSKGVSPVSYKDTSPSFPAYGVAYLAMKRNYVGFSSGARHLKSLVDDDGVHLVKEMSNQDIWKLFFK